MKKLLSFILCSLAVQLSASNIPYERRLEGMHAFFVEIARTSQSHSADNKLKPLAKRFLASVEQASQMLDDIMTGFSSEPFPQNEKILQDFIAISTSFGEYPYFAKMTKEKLLVLRTEISEYQMYLETIAEEQAETLTEQQRDFLIQLRHFNTFLIADILHEQYLPLMEGQHGILGSFDDDAAQFAGQIFAASAGSYLAVAALSAHRDGTRIQAHDAAIAGGFGLFLAWLTYRYARHRNKVQK